MRWIMCIAPSGEPREGAVTQAGGDVGGTEEVKFKGRVLARWGVSEGEKLGRGTRWVAWVIGFVG